MSDTSCPRHRRCLASVLPTLPFHKPTSTDSWRVCNSNPAPCLSRWLPGSQCGFSLPAFWFTMERRYSRALGLGVRMSLDHSFPHCLVSAGPVRQKGVEETEWGGGAWRAVTVCLTVDTSQDPVTMSESSFSRPTPRGCDLSSAPHGGVPRYPLAGRRPPEGSDRPDELGLRGKGTQPLPLPTSSHKLLQLTTLSPSILPPFF